MRSIQARKLKLLKTVIWDIPSYFFIVIEVRDSRTGYFIPVRYGLGLLPDGIVVGASPSPSSSASPGNHLEKVTLTVLVFGPESVSYERSRRETAAKFHIFSARAFLVKISQSQYSMIYTILRLLKWLVFQYFQDPRLLEWLVFQYFQDR